MISPARVNSRPRPGLHWALLTVLVVSLVWLPAWLASSFTSSSEPVDFTARPWRAWQFLGAMVVASPGAAAPSPGKALQKAEKTLGGERAEVSSVELMYMPGTSTLEFDMVTASGKHPVVVDPRPSLIWKVRGRDDYHGAEGVVGLMDFRSGDMVWTARSNGKDAE